VSWLRRFGEPIVLRDGARLATLGDAIAHLADIIPEAKRDLPEVRTAFRLLTNAAEKGDPVDFARIAMLQAINRHAMWASDPSREDHNRPPVAAGQVTARAGTNSSPRA
jgi:hypothetical protein